MKIIGLDLETTGFLDSGDHRIIEVYAGLWDVNGVMIDEFYSHINPERSIPAEATKVHHITYADVASAPIWGTVAPSLRAFLEQADYFVAHNAPFDIGFLKQEYGRNGEAMVDRPAIDTAAYKGATPDGKTPTLQELCFAMGVDYDPALAHAAEYDVRVMMEAFFNGLAWDHFHLVKETA